MIQILGIWYKLKEFLIKKIFWLKTGGGQSVMPCDVVKIMEMRGEVEEKTPKKDIDNPSFLRRHMAHF